MDINRLSRQAICILPYLKLPYPEFAGTNVTEIFFRKEREWTYHPEKLSCCNVCGHKLPAEPEDEYGQYYYSYVRCELQSRLEFPICIGCWERIEITELVSILQSICKKIQVEEEDEKPFNVLFNQHAAEDKEDAKRLKSYLYKIGAIQSKEIKYSNKTIYPKSTGNFDFIIAQFSIMLTRFSNTPHLYIQFTVSRRVYYVTINIRGNETIPELAELYKKYMAKVWYGNSRTNKYNF